MTIKKIHIKNLQACSSCDHCFEKRFPWYNCSLNNDNFGNISQPHDCDDYVASDDDYDDYEEDQSFDPCLPVECPICGNDAFWEGQNYVCNDCGWVGFPDD